MSDPSVQLTAAATDDVTNTPCLKSRSKRQKPEDDDSPNSRRSQAIDKEVDLCNHCHNHCTNSKDKLGEAVQCDLCACWVHASCEGIFSSSYSLLGQISSDLSENVIYLCNLNSCYTRFKQILNNAVAPVNSLDQSMQALKEVQLTLQKSISQLSLDICNLCDNNTALCKKVDSTLDKLSSSSGSNTDNDISASSAQPPSLGDITASFSSMLSEQKEKEKRRFNLILHNISESIDSVAVNRKKHDIDSATVIFQRYIGIPVTINNAIRIGKKLTDKSRLLKITLSSEDDKLKILRNCT